MIFIADLNHDLNRFKSLDLNQLNPDTKDCFIQSCIKYFDAVNWVTVIACDT